MKLLIKSIRFLCFICVVGSIRYFSSHGSAARADEIGGLPKINHDIRGIKKKDRLRITFGSCISHTNSSIWGTIISHSPDMMLFLGDNVYLGDAQFGDYGKIMQFYRVQFSGAGVAALLKKIPTFAIFSDHDYGPDNSDRSFEHGDISKRAFHDFWRLPAERSVMPDGGGGNAYKLEFEKVKLLFTDDRSFRVKYKRPEPALFGKAQMAWLEREIRESKHRVVLLVAAGPILNAASYRERLSQYPAEYTRLIDAIAASPSTVLILSGDRHNVELLEREYKGKRILEFGSSPLNSHHAPADRYPKDPYQVEAVFGRNNFGELDLDFTGPAPRYAIRFFDPEGKELLAREY